MGDSTHYTLQKTKTKTLFYKILIQKTSSALELTQKMKFIYSYIDQYKISICFCTDGVIIAAQCTATFLRSTVLPRIWVLGHEYAD